MNRTTRRSPAQLLLGYIPKSTADAVLLESIQKTLDEIDLTRLRKEAKKATDAEQETQKARFDARRFKAPVYQVGDVVMVATNPAATGQSRKLLAKAKGPFKVTAKLPNDRYEVEDLREMKKARRQKSVVAVDSIRKWITFDAME